MKMGTYLRTSVTVPGDKNIPAGRVARDRIRGKQCEGESEFAADEFDATQMSDITQLRWPAGIVSGEKPLFLNIYADNQFQMKTTSGARQQGYQNRLVIWLK